jgi:cleavage and polyadenylation specificity factor subunit 2
LEGGELALYNAELRTRQEREAAQAALIAKSKSIIEEDDESVGSSSEAGDDDTEELLGARFDLYVRDATRAGGFFKQTQSYRMFPYVERRKRFDDYGEILPTDVLGRSAASGIGIGEVGRASRGERNGTPLEESDREEVSDEGRDILRLLLLM